MFANFHCFRSVCLNPSFVTLFLGLRRLTEFLINFCLGSVGLKRSLVLNSNDGEQLPSVMVMLGLVIFFVVNFVLLGW